MTDRAALLQGLEALLFVSDEPVASVVLAQALDVDRREAEALCEELARGWRNETPALGPAQRRRRLAAHDASRCRPRRRAVRPLVAAGAADEGGARDARDRRLQAARDAASGLGDPRRELGRACCARSPTAACRGGRPRGGARAADAVRHDARVPRAPRPAVARLAPVRWPRCWVDGGSPRPIRAEDVSVADDNERSRSRRGVARARGARPARAGPGGVRLPSSVRATDRGRARHGQRRRSPRSATGSIPDIDEVTRRRCDREPRPQREVLRPPQAPRESRPRCTTRRDAQTSEASCPKGPARVPGRAAGPRQRGAPPPHERRRAGEPPAAPALRSREGVPGGGRRGADGAASSRGYGAGSSWKTERPARLARDGRARAEREARPVAMTEGRKREVRRMLAEVGLPVVRLVRAAHRPGEAGRTARPARSAS